MGDISNQRKVMMKKDETVIQLLKKNAHPLANMTSDLDPLLDRIGDASLVLLGEATHGTHEFYAIRAAITKRLILEKNFTFIAIEGDCPDAYRVNQFIKGHLPVANVVAALADFKRFPAWMWRNQEIVQLVEWLYTHNKKAKIPIGFYGLDLYSLHRSMEVVIQALEKIDPHFAERARRRYSCFDMFADPQQYGYFAALYPSESCKQAVMAQLLELQKKQQELFKKDHEYLFEEKRYVEQNARVVQNAEHYYRSMFEGDPAHSWNIRDTHMMETLASLMHFEHNDKQPPKGIVWAHNSHIGDARATQMASVGEINLGQLVREQFGEKAVLIGFTTYTGSVSAASQWGGSVERKRVQPALTNSFELLFHQLQLPNFFVVFDNPILKEALVSERLERAIGVVYAPQTERESHYFYAQLAQQFDAIIHNDVTRAVEPLDKTAAWEKGELPETYPFGV